MTNIGPLSDAEEARAASAVESIKVGLAGGTLTENDKNLFVEKIKDAIVLGIIPKTEGVTQISEISGRIPESGSEKKS
ncbi:MAG: hypothetical protein AAB550_00940 [Patescibacteria group bacterium]